MSLFRTLQGTIQKDWKACISFADTTTFSACLAEWLLEIALKLVSVVSLIAEGGIDILRGFYASCT